MKEWLTNGYHDKHKIEDDYKCKKLTKKKRNALMAVHDCDRREATEPSAKDLEFLNKIYRSKSALEIISCILLYSNHCTIIIALPFFWFQERRHGLHVCACAAENF